MAFGRSDDSRLEPELNASKTVTSNSSAKSVAFLGQGSKVVGVLTFGGPVEIDGYVEGELNADRLTVGESAVINAKISGAEIVIKGSVNGDITASKRLLLQKPAKVTGNITSTNLSIEEGVIFEGQCSMSNASSQHSKGISPKVITSEKVAV